MARKQDKGESSHARTPPLTQLEQQVMAHLMTAIELGGFDDVATVENLAKAFGREPSRFKQVVNRLVRKGYVTTSGHILESVYPTVAALVHQKPGLSEAEARKLLKRLNR